MYFLFSGSKLQKDDTSSKCLIKNILERLWLQYFSAWCKSIYRYSLHHALKSLLSVYIQQIRIV